MLEARAAPASLSISVPSSTCAWIRLSVASRPARVFASRSSSWTRASAARACRLEHRQIAACSSRMRAAQRGDVGFRRRDVRARLLSSRGRVGLGEFAPLCSEPLARCASRPSRVRPACATCACSSRNACSACAIASRAPARPFLRGAVRLLELAALRFRARQGASAPRRSASAASACRRCSHMPAACVELAAVALPLLDVARRAGRGCGLQRAAGLGHEARAPPRAATPRHSPRRARPARRCTASPAA